jgi:hypothetical protein
MHRQIHPPTPSMPPILHGDSAGNIDTSLSLLSYHYIISPLHPFSSSNIVSLAAARKSRKLAPDALMNIELRLGHFFGQLHSQVQNEWFGMPVIPSESPKSTLGLPGLSIALNKPPHETGYSWQETFTALLEDLLGKLESEDSKSGSSPTVPYGEVRKYLSRAIGSFLFDDVEVPSLVWFTGSEEDVFIIDPSIDQAQADQANWKGPAPGSIAAVMPSVTHAIWGDPLLETIMLGSLDEEGKYSGKPSQAFMEGYRAGGGQNLVVFPRHKTKRLWYSVFVALLTLVGGVKDRGTNEENSEKERVVREKKAWAREVLIKNVDLLRDAPCY